VSDGAGHYQGASGEAYFAWQKRTGGVGGHIEARKFSGVVKPNDVVLDFGCGSGAMLTSLDCGHRIGVDVNPAARREAEALAVEVHATLDDILPSSIDVVVSNHALEHVTDPFAVCRRLHEVLVPGGRLQLCLPIDDWRNQRSFRPQDTDHHLYTWTPQLIGNVLTDAGFVVVSSEVLVHAWPPMWDWLDRHLPIEVFDATCSIWARLRRRRQVVVRAFKPHRGDD
jgi:SAM-dependent methyltransferase